MASLDNKKHIAIFASGSGSNAERIIQYFTDHPSIQVSLIVCNNSKAGIIDRGVNHNIPVELIDKSQYVDSGYMISLMRHNDIDFIVLAGYLKLIPASFVQHFTNRMVNIHPALLPKYGGKGMYGHHVHEAIVANKEGISGLTIHFVSPIYDEGKYIFQAKCKLSKFDTPNDVANKVLRLEHMYYAPVIEQVVLEHCS